MSKADKTALIRVLSHYDLGIIHSLKRLQAGRDQSQKILITADRGKTILKYHRVEPDDVDRLKFAHGVVAYLARRGAAVCPPIATRDRDRTVVTLEGRAYEMFPYVEGKRYPYTEAASADAGHHLGQLHHALSYFKAAGTLSTLSYHDAPGIRRRLRTTLRERLPQNSNVARLLEDLHFAYDDATARVNRLGCDGWASQIVHGDWHPGNLLYRGDSVVAILDFDTIRMALPVLDLANGLLQFSIQTGHPKIDQWPAALDMSRLTQFMAGYRLATEPTAHELKAIPNLMIESALAEAVIPIAATGKLGPYEGYAFLQMVQRKIQWIAEHRQEILNELKRVCDQKVPAKLPQNREPGQAQNGA